MGVVACRVVALGEVADAVGRRTEREWQEWAIARRRVDTVPAPDGGSIADTQVAPDPQDVDAQPASQDAAKPKSQVSVWREGLAWSVLSVDYRRILTAWSPAAG